MCVETITIAQCAPLSPPEMSFTCGKLHMIAHDRVVCDLSRGACICFFGTCGTVTRVVPTDGVDLSSVSKVRCASCTTREDNVGDRRQDREILESALLQRPAIPDAAWEEHSSLLKKLWHSKHTCPYHPDASVIMAKATGEEPAKEHVWVEGVTKLAVDSAPVDTSFVEVAIDKDSSLEEAAADTSMHTEAGSGPRVDPWTSDAGTAENAGVDSTPAKDYQREDEATIETSSDTSVKNGLERDVGIETSRWNPQGPKASEQSEGQTQEVQHVEEAQKVEEGQSPGGAHVSRRPVNFSFSAETAEKLRETTEKFASLKSFLAGTA
ncbi:uncharacterized protein B0J16DRAFT_369894 [Fusarium flagelliforme]|uniref:Uncharacterized protein n=1 Tax=Fusarium flagelliforme TaxID=2675880 RepID=A0A395ME07_9HYPO|nr:uncharacterized protein B0J16DRAFT_369894 [Fusarium flagelliforme]KAH7193821.1 hypothetical protein B0J16DRAFT_369894 [Fusarium flagelliforme]RFN46157.1 hypothetical protein FIE12Z_9575 [Fusarium flagelliforme]